MKNKYLIIILLLLCAGCSLPEKKEDKIRREAIFSTGSDTHTNGYSVADDALNALTSPQVDVEWVETHVKGKKLIEGHRVWTIIEDAQWIGGN